MTSRLKSRFGKGGPPRRPSAAALVCTAVLVMDMLLLGSLPSQHRFPDAGDAYPGDRLRGRVAMTPAAALSSQRAAVMGLSADPETLTLYNDMVRFWGLDIEIGRVGRISLAEDMPIAAARAGLVRNGAAFAPGEEISGPRP